MNDLNIHLEPVNDDYVIAIVDAAETTTSTGLVIPEAAQQRPPYATVLATTTTQTKLTKNDRIMIRPYAGQPITHNGIDLIAIHINEILAKLN